MAASAADPVKPSERPDRTHRCGNWVREADGGSFSSPHYPQSYPPNKECLFVLEGKREPAHSATLANEGVDFE